MKKILIAGFFVLAATGAFAQWDTTGTLTINGNMPVITQIRIVDNGVTLDLQNAGVDVLLAEIQERSNSTTSYTVSVTSANSGTLVGSTHAEALTYSLDIGGATIDLSSGAAQEVSNNAGRTTAVGIPKEIRISYGSGGTDGQFLAEDSYSDTLTFEIAPN